MSFLKKKTIVNEMAEQAKKVAVKYNLRELYIKCDQETVWEKPVAFTTQSYRRRNSSNFNRGASFKTGLYFDDFLNTPPPPPSFLVIKEGEELQYKLQGLNS